MAPKVSIIVPVHNAGKFFHKCLDSLVNQTLCEIEVILVLDKPTDGSDKVAEKYAKKDSRIRVIKNKENLHIGFSRNEGIKAAKGEYIGFCDHDDYCELTMFETLYGEAKKENADVVVSDFWLESDTGKYHFGFPKGLSKSQFRQKTFEALILGLRSVGNTDSFQNVNNVWNQIFRRELLVRNNICFDDNRISTYEDSVFNIKVYHFAQNVAYIPENFYHHLSNEQNSFNSYGYYSLTKILKHFEIIVDFLQTNSVLETCKNSLAQNMLKRLYTSFRNEIKFKGIKSIPFFIKEVKNSLFIQPILSELKTDKQRLKTFPLTKRIFFYTIISK